MPFHVWAWHELYSSIHFNKGWDKADWEDSLTHIVYYILRRKLVLKPETYLQPYHGLVYSRKHGHSQFLKRETETGQQQRHREGLL